MGKSPVIKVLIAVFWIALILVSIHFYLDNAVAYFFGYRSDRFGDSLLNNQFWFVVHMAGGTLSLFLGPIQFWTYFRNRFIKFHRILGRVYIGGSLVAGLSALRLSLINDCHACRYSLLLLSVLLLFFTSAAYYSIRKYNIEAHKRFMIRSYVCALAFVFVRLPQLLPMDFLFGMLESPEERRIVGEWVFSLVPLFAVESWITWIPSLRGLVARRNSNTT